MTKTTDIYVLHVTPSKPSEKLNSSYTANTLEDGEPKVLCNWPGNPIHSAGLEDLAHALPWQEDKLRKELGDLSYVFGRDGNFPGQLTIKRPANHSFFPNGKLEYRSLTAEEIERFWNAYDRGKNLKSEQRY
tara:strand:+ start:232 stop:627 length:396 start_codon:yes stop_codon:yes gene_type:complete